MLLIYEESANKIYIINYANNNSANIISTLTLQDKLLHMEIMKRSLILLTKVHNENKYQMVEFLED